MKRVYKTIFTLFFVQSILACKTPKPGVVNAKIKLPSNYELLPDSNNISKINWRSYLGDPILISLIDTAIKNNLDHKIAMQRIAIAQSWVRMAKGEMFPKVYGNVGIGSNKYAQYTQENLGNSSTEYQPGKTIPNPLPDIYTGLASSWEINLWGKVRSKRKGFQQRFWASIEGKKLVLSNVIEELTLNYFELLALDREQAIINQTLLKQEEALEVVKIQKETGRTNELAVQQFNAQLLSTQALEKEISQKIIETENRVNFLLGRLPQKIERTSTSLFQDNSELVLSGVPAQLLVNRPDIKEAEYALNATYFDLQVARSAFFPTINLASAIGFQSFNPQFLLNVPASLGYSISGALLAPLVNRSAIQSHFKTAQSEQLTALYQYQKTIIYAYAEVLSELSNKKHLETIFELKKEQNRILENAVQTSSELYRTVKANYLEVLLAQQNSLQAEIELIEVAKRKKVATIKLYKVLGGAWVN